MSEAVLFDLDGTIADTAPDLGAALNRLRKEEGLSDLPLDVLRPVASNGVRGLLKVGFGLAPQHPVYAELARRFLSHYGDALCVRTTLFDGVAELLDALDMRGVSWGIVTNKQERFTLPLLQELDLARRAGCIVSGDTTPRPKPHPDPLLFASAALGVAPERCLYVGDDVRDVQAGRAAGMATVVASYGYLGDGEPIERWGADYLIASPGDVLRLIGAARDRIQ
jgi:N-acetyl-D-muramate 6-phosphate phosphatase